MPGQGNGEYTLGTSVVHSLHCLVIYYMPSYPKLALSNYNVVDNDGGI
jgi:hypothetical protein